MARPTNEEKYSIQGQKAMLNKAVGEALVKLRSEIKKADVNTLANFVTKMLPLLLNEDTQTTSDVTLELLTKKALRVKVRINEANTANLTTEEIEEEQDET